MLWLVKILKALSGVESAPAEKLWFFELIMAVDFGVSETDILF
jgi:hypothetical protein